MTIPTIDLSGRTAVITGASRGIGYAVAEQFARAGADVHIVAENDDVHEAAITIGQSCGRQVTPHVCDVTDREAVQALALRVPPPDVLVNNAGWRV